MQCVRSKRAPVATSPSIGTAAFALKSGWSFLDRLPRRGRSSVPPRPLAPWHGQRISGAAHDAIRQWCRANNRQHAGPNWEIYGHWQSEWNTNPSQIRSDIYYLLTLDAGSLWPRANDVRFGVKADIA